MRSMIAQECEAHHDDWDIMHVQGPDVEDRYTLQQLARMTGNAYALPGGKNWYDLDEAWNTVLIPVNFTIGSDNKL